MEHISDIKNGHVWKSAVCENTADKLHTFAKEIEYIYRIIREVIEIHKHPNLNRADGRISTTWHLLIKP